MSYPELKTPLIAAYGSHSQGQQQIQGLSRPKQAKWVCHEGEPSTSSSRHDSRKRVSGLTTVCVCARKRMSNLKQEKVFNSRHKANPLPSGTEISFKDLQRVRKSHRSSINTSFVLR